jgi:hypothetical protein
MEDFDRWILEEENGACSNLSKISVSVILKKNPLGTNH